MKKIISVMFLVAVFALCGSVSAFAVPAVTGTLVPDISEWANLNASASPYPYYLEVFDPNEADNQVDTMDISHIVLLQELSGFGGTPSTADDGIYLLIEVYGAPGPSLALPTDPPYTGIIPQSLPTIRMAGDFLGDGLNDIAAFNIFVRTYNTLPIAGLPANDVTEVCVGTQVSCLVSGPWVNLTGAGGSAVRGTVLEYFFPTATFGTPPNTPFPGSFIGTITYDNGSSGVNSSDDVVVGTLIPEPASMFLMLSGLMGLVAKRKFLAKR